MPDGRILYARYEDFHVLRFEGEVPYTLSPSLEHFLERLFTGPVGRGFVVDLTRTRSIDSTNLGLLARIAKHMSRVGGPRVTIVSDQDDVNKVLLGLGFDEVFDLVGENFAASAEGREIAVEPLKEADLAAAVLDAHRALMSLNARNRNEFKDVVELLERWEQARGES